MANNMVPAVTLLSAAFGIALMGVDDKQRFLEPLHALMKAMGRVMNFVVEITPIGVIPIAAFAAGTLSLKDLERLEVYFIAFFVAALLIGILLFLLVSVVTPFRFREVAKASSNTLLTAFVTSNVFVVLQQARGNIRNAYDYWILGKGAERRQPRWCIGRDVLGWFK